MTIRSFSCLKGIKAEGRLFCANALHPRHVRACVSKKIRPSTLVVTSVSGLRCESALVQERREVGF